VIEKMRILGLKIESKKLKIKKRRDIAMKKITLKVGVGIFVCLMVVFSSMIGHAQSQKITMKWAGLNAPTHPGTTIMFKVKEAIENRTGGRVNIEVFSAGSLIPGREMLEACRAGLVDAAEVIPAYFPGQMPLSNMAYMIPLANNYDQSYAVLKEVRPLVEEEYTANGLKLLVLMPFRHELYFRKPINLDVPDWSGLKFRPLGGLAKVMAKDLGAGCVSMSSSEAGVALATRVIDGIGTSLSSYYYLGLHEHAPYVFVTNSMIAMLNSYAFSVKKWKALPKDVQNIVSEEWTRIMDEWFLEYNRNEDDKCLNMAKKEGAVMMVPTDSQMKIWREKMKSTWAMFPKKVGPKGQQYLDIVKRHLK